MPQITISLVLVSDFDFELPEEFDCATASSGAIWCADVAARSRERASGAIAGSATFPELLHEGDVLVLNDSRVIPARLLGQQSVGQTPERSRRCSLSKPSEWEWKALVAPGT